MRKTKYTNMFSKDGFFPRRSSSLAFAEKWIEIDLDKIKGNVAAIKKRLNPKVKLMAVVKADAYGHGIIPVSKAVLCAGADILGVISVDEAAILRKSGVKNPIFILAPSLPSRIPEIIKLNLIPTVDSQEFLRLFNARLKKRKIHREYCLDMDFGIGRWGIKPEKFISFVEKTENLKNAVLSSISTHINYFPNKNMVEAQEKLSLFRKICEKVLEKNPKIKLHAANSSVLCDFPQWQFDMVRIGNLIYGLYPSRIYPGPPIKGIRRPWKFRAKIISIRKVRKGQSIGYASEYVSPKNMTIACIPSGYGDGLTMEPKEKNINISAGSNYWGIIKGRKAFFVGKPGIIHTLLDITNVPNVKVGDPVELPVRRTIAPVRIPRIYNRTARR